MTISGLTIFKLLPGAKKTLEANCKKCGCPTCMAFAMKLAKGEITLEDCEHVTEELRQLLESLSGKTQIEIPFGLNANPVKIGGETVLYRHDKTFINPTCLSIRLKTSQGIDYILETARRVSEYIVERVGEQIKVDSITIENDNTDSNTFINVLNGLVKNHIASNISLILVSDSFDELVSAAKLLSDSQKPILYLKKADFSKLLELNKTTTCPICLEADNIDDLIDISQNLGNDNVEDIILTIPSESKVNIIEILTLIRRSVINENFKALRFPVMVFASDCCLSNDEIEEGLWAGNLMCKYANVLVMDNFNPAIMYSLFTLRQNLFTDPQKPLQIEPNLYSIGETNELSPVIVTTNFALTYFTVAGEIEASNIPCYLLITPSDGMSVLTAWSANKFSGEIIAKAVKETQLETKIKHRNLIISGYVASLKEEIEEELPGWEVKIAPMEAVNIPEYLNNYDICQFTLQ